MSETLQFITLFLILCSLVATALLVFHIDDMMNKFQLYCFGTGSIASKQQQNSNCDSNCTYTYVNGSEIKYCNNSR